MEVFPERDGNEFINDAFACVNLLVRMEVFPERDGNDMWYISNNNAANFRPNGGLP